MLNLTVSKDNKENNNNYYTIQEAINAVPYNTEATITIKEGIYKEKLFCEKNNITIKGEGNVVITYSDGAKEILEDGFKRGTFRTYTAFFSGKKLHLENLTIKNEAGKGEIAGQAIALYLDTTQAYLKNVTLTSSQDTLFLAPLPDEEREKRGFYGPRCFSERKLTKTIIEGGRIEGGVDFIFGGGDATFNNTEIVSIEKGYVSAPSGKKEDQGFIFNNCTFTTTTNLKEEIYLMRPWRDEGKAEFRNCTFGPHIAKPGFCPWSGREDKAPLSTFKVTDCEYLLI